MKSLACCPRCNAFVIARTEYLSPNGKRNCGICQKSELCLLPYEALKVIFDGNKDYAY